MSDIPGADITEFKVYVVGLHYLSSILSFNPPPPIHTTWMIYSNICRMVILSHFLRYLVGSFLFKFLHAISRMDFYYKLNFW